MDVASALALDEDSKSSAERTEDALEAAKLSTQALQVEEELKAVNESKAIKEEQELKEQAGQLSKSERLQRLMGVLQKSRFYSGVLAEKIERNDEARRIKEKHRMNNRKKNVDDKKGDDKKSDDDSKGGDKKNVDKKSESKRSKRKRGGDKKTDKENDDHNVDHTGDHEEERQNKEETKASSSAAKPIPPSSGAERSEAQPMLLTGGVMRDYQIEGYEWVATLFENGINGILADEMGLGKTIQTIAIICHLVEMGVSGPFLVVAPLSTLPNWVNEFHRFAPQLPVVLYHGSQQERMELRRQKLKKREVVPDVGRSVCYTFVTSYEIAMNDCRFFARTRFSYLVVDEGHRIKNMNCRLLKTLKTFIADNRLLLTGTPLQNNLKELWSLLNFIMPEIFEDLGVFESWFDPRDLDNSPDESQRIVKQETQDSILVTLHEILAPFLLRRVKADVDLRIPPKKEVLVYCPMVEKQRTFYEAIANSTIQDLLKEQVPEEEKKEEAAEELPSKRRRCASKVDYSLLVSEGEQGEEELLDYIEKLNVMQEKREQQWSTSLKKKYLRKDADISISLKRRLMDLRKTTNHPYLIEHPLTDDGLYYKTGQELIDCSGKLKVLDQMLQSLLERGHKVLIFSQMTRMLNILGDYLNMKEWRYSRLDGSMTFEDRQKDINAFNNSDEVKIFLLSTRAGGLGINLTAADTCIIYDSDWNPQQDLQAQDRCHRIGQTRPVVVFRLVTAKTIDQKMVERATAKRRIEKMILHHKKFKSQDKEGLKRNMETFSTQELLDLLNSVDHSSVIDRGQEGLIFSPKELDALLDRSDMMENKEAKPIKKTDYDGLFKVVDAKAGGDDQSLSVISA